MANSLREFGWRQPIVVDESNNIIVGDTRYLGAQQLGMTHVPVWPAADLPPEKVHAYRLADNRLAEESEWDDEALTAELKLLQELGISNLDDMQTLTGFDQSELDQYLGGDTTGHTLEPVDVQEFPPYTWALIGVPTARYHEIAESIEAIAAHPEFFCEVTVNDDRP
jgi:site-specific DNA-methyltransferase (adenine-specific)